MSHPSCNLLRSFLANSVNQVPLSEVLEYLIFFFQCTDQNRTFSWNNNNDNNNYIINFCSFFCFFDTLYFYIMRLFFIVIFIILYTNKKTILMHWFLKVATIVHWEAIVCLPLENILLLPGNCNYYFVICFYPLLNHGDYLEKC
jgi:hypothetical protein